MSAGKGRRLVVEFTFPDGSKGKRSLYDVRRDLEREARYFREAAKTEQDPAEARGMLQHATKIEEQLREEFDRISTVYARNQRPNAEAGAAVAERHAALLAECRKHFTDDQIAAMTSVRPVIKAIRSFISSAYGVGKGTETLRRDFAAVRKALQPKQ